MLQKHNYTKNKPADRNDPDTLFVYGSLNSLYHLQLLTGKQLRSEEATLVDYRRIHPESGYPFAVPWRGSKIDGQLVYGVTPDIIKKLDDYESEGNLYFRKTVQVKLGQKSISAWVYIGNPEALKPLFKAGLEKRHRIEQFVEENVNRYLSDKADRCLIYDRESIPLRVTKELLSEEIHSIIRQYFQEAGFPPFIIKHEIESANIPRLTWLKRESKALNYAANYIKLMIKFIVFNQLEERFRTHFRSQIEIQDEYYMHTVSALMSLKMLTLHSDELNAAIQQLNLDSYQPKMSYIDYTVAAIFIAEQIFSMPRAEIVVEWLRSNRRVGGVPLGAELEFSNLGVNAIKASPGEDSFFDSFYYFYDFDLMRRGWKLGAHIDDHKFLAGSATRTRGFLELAFGRYKLFGDVSKPATQDTWILSRLIDLAVRYMEVKPHSLHISMQISQNQNFNKLTSPDHLLCLLLLGGDLREDSEKKLREMRIHRGEIIYPKVGLYFSRLNRHHKNPDDDSWTYVVEYQFPRLYFEYDYQPLIMAIKGFQIAANPYPFKDCKECPYEGYHAELERFLKKWASRPTSLPASSIEAFLSLVEEGLWQEAQKTSPKYKNYVNEMVDKIEKQIIRRNKRIRHYYDRKQKIPY
jgi:gamma-glutamylcyclotransferase (GGCT)/AIG2-like uncharacterized protein YtfP